jgi:hypothetical protein
MVKEAVYILSEIDKVDEKINLLNEQKNMLYHKLKEIKQYIENDNKHLIGKKAKCIQEDNSNVELICECSKVICKDDFNIKPLFSYKGKKIIVSNYEWLC